MPKGMSWHTQQAELALMRSTAKVAQVENAIRRPIEQASWSIEPNGAPAEVVDFVSMSLGLPIKGEEGQSARRVGRVSWHEHLAQALESVFTGVAFFELVFDDGASGVNRLRKLAFLSLIHISEPTRPCGTSRMPSSA